MEQQTQTGTAPEENGLRLPEKQSMRMVILAGILILALVLVYALVRNHRVYTSYEVISAYARGEDTSVYYHVNDDGMIHYSKDGISLVSQGGDTLWSQTYQLSTPIMAASKDYVTIADMEGNDIYVFNRLGQCGHLTTAVPVGAVSISDQGVVGAILSDAGSNYVNLYDNQGQELISIKATLENTGYPLAMGMSSDARKLAVSYLVIGGGSVQTRVVFYDFSDSKGGHEISEELLDGLCPKITFLDSSRAIIFREQGFTIYSVGGKVSVEKEVACEDEIRSVFSAGGKVGLILRNPGEEGRYRLEIYDRAGQVNMTAYTDLDYREIFADDDEIILYNEQEAMVYKYSGSLRFHGTFDLAVTGMFPSWETGTYWIVNAQALEEIRIR